MVPGCQVHGHADALTRRLLPRHPPGLLTPLPAVSLLVLAVKCDCSWGDFLCLVPRHTTEAQKRLEGAVRSACALGDGRQPAELGWGLGHDALGTRAVWSGDGPPPRVPCLPAGWGASTGLVWFRSVTRGSSMGR